jgi:hypothetical protein
MMEKIADMRFRKEEDAKKEVQEAGGPYDDEFDEDGEEFFDEEEPEDSEEEDVLSRFWIMLIRRIHNSLNGEGWKKVVVCSIYSQRACLSNVS